MSFVTPPDIVATFSANFSPTAPAVLSDDLAVDDLVIVGITLGAGATSYFTASGPAGITWNNAGRLFIRATLSGTVVCVIWGIVTAPISSGGSITVAAWTDAGNSIPDFNGFMQGRVLRRDGANTSDPIGGSGSLPLADGPEAQTVGASIALTTEEDDSGLIGFFAAYDVHSLPTVPASGYTLLEEWVDSGSNAILWKGDAGAAGSKTIALDWSTSSYGRGIAIEVKSSGTIIPSTPSGGIVLGGSAIYTRQVGYPSQTIQPGTDIWTTDCTIVGNATGAGALRSGDPAQYVQIPATKHYTFRYFPPTLGVPPTPRGPSTFPIFLAAPGLAMTATVTLYKADGSTVVKAWAPISVTGARAQYDFALTGMESDALAASDYLTGLVLTIESELA